MLEDDTALPPRPRRRGDRMNRREMITVLGGLVAWPQAALAQQRAKVHRVAFVAARSPIRELVGVDPVNPVVRAFARAMRSLGYIEGSNLTMAWRSAEGRFERFPEIIAELLSLKVDVIVTVTNPMTRIAKEMTRTVPIVMAHSTN